MAITAAERTQIIMWLGYPAGMRYTAAIYAIDSAIARLEPSEEDMVRSILVTLKAIDEGTYGTSTSAGVIARAGLKRVDEIEFQDGMAWLNGRLAGRADLVRRLANLLGVEILNGAAGGGGRIPLGWSPRVAGGSRYENSSERKFP